MIDEKERPEEFDNIEPTKLWCAHCFFSHIYNKIKYTGLLIALCQKWPYPASWYYMKVTTQTSGSIICSVHHRSLCIVRMCMPLTCGAGAKESDCLAIGLSGESDVIDTSEVPACQMPRLRLFNNYSMPSLLNTFSSMEIILKFMGWNAPIRIFESVAISQYSLQNLIQCRIL